MVKILSSTTPFKLMSKQRNNKLLLKVLVLGGLIASLIYFFHPEVSQLSLIINNKPVADPLVRFAALPTLIFSAVFLAFLMLLVFLGVGMFIFIATLVFIIVTICFVAPYFWPILVFNFLVIGIMSVGNNKNVKTN